MLRYIVEDALDGVLALASRAALLAVSEVEDNPEVVRVLERIRKETGADVSAIYEAVYATVDAARGNVYDALNDITPDADSVVDSILLQIRESADVERVARAIFESMHPDRGWNTALTEERAPFLSAARAAIEEVFNALQ